MEDRGKWSAVVDLRYLIALASASTYSILVIPDSIYKQDQKPGWHTVPDLRSGITALNTTFFKSRAESISIENSFIEDIYIFTKLDQVMPKNPAL